MSLESLLRPAKWLDKEVQREFTKLGKRIPEEQLYKVTTAAQMAGITGTITWGHFGIPVSINSVISAFLAAWNFPDFLCNFDGLQGRIRKDSDGEAISIYPIDDFCARYNRALRLPVFLTGVGFLGKAVYDAANYFMNGEPLTSDTAANATTGFGFLSLASSMYLKDQDPKLLERKPSRVKEFFKRMYERAKEFVPSPEPTPQPVPIQTFSMLKNYLS